MYRFLRDKYGWDYNQIAQMTPAQQQDILRNPPEHTFKDDRELQQHLTGRRYG